MNEISWDQIAKQMPFAAFPADPKEPEPICTTPPVTAVPLASDTSPEVERPKAEGDYLIKVDHACRRHGVTRVAKLLGVHVDTIYSWLSHKHRPRERCREALLDAWLSQMKSMATRGLEWAYAECCHEEDPARQELALHAVALMVGLGLREAGGNFDFEIKRTRRPRLTLYAKPLPPLAIRFYRYDDSNPYMKLYTPDGSRVRFECDCYGLANLTECVERLQREAVSKQKIPKQKTSSDRGSLPSLRWLDQYLAGELP